MAAKTPDPKSRSKKTVARKTTASRKTATGRSGRTDNAGGAGPDVSGERRSGPVAGTALLSGVTFSAKGVQYAEVDGLAVFEGDIVLGTVQELRKAAAMGVDTMFPTAVGVTGQNFRWPNAIVPFEIDTAFPDPQRVTNAIAHWESHTRMRFVQRTSANETQFPDFVRFVPGDGCSSHVGRSGGLQLVTLGPDCSTGNAIHEIGHTVGLWHEQSREDRDLFVTVDFSNIDPSMQHNFLQHITDGDDLGPYDYGSIMHYPPTAFAIDSNRPTLIARQPLPAGVVMGQRTGLSQGDIDGVHAMYPAPAIMVNEVTKRPVTDVFATSFLQDPREPVTSAPFVLAMPPQAPALVGQPDGLSEQVRQLTALVGTLQHGLSRVMANQNSLASQFGSLMASGSR
ncbi:Dot/Icm T4SS effector Zinc-dependent metalloprotease LegP [Streptomyces sp. NPDC001177]